MGLAPENASVLIHPLVATRKSPSEGFAYDVPLSLVKSLKELRPWATEREEPPGRFAPDGSIEALFFGR